MFRVIYTELLRNIFSEVYSRNIVYNIGTFLANIAKVVFVKGNKSEKNCKRELIQEQSVYTNAWA